MNNSGNDLLRKRVPVVKLLAVFIMLTLQSCSKEENNTVCQETSIGVNVNGKYIEFNQAGRGLDLRSYGYELLLVFSNYNQTTKDRHGISMIVPYKKQGENIITKFHFSQSLNSESFSGDYVQGEFHSNVIANNGHCFQATFYGKLSDGNREIVLSGGNISVTYKVPFDE